jgi:hypothetical protein
VVHPGSSAGRYNRIHDLIRFFLFIARMIQFLHYATVHIPPASLMCPIEQNRLIGWIDLSVNL